MGDKLKKIYGKYIESKLALIISIITLLIVLTKDFLF